MFSKIKNASEEKIEFRRCRFRQRATLYLIQRRGKTYRRFSRSFVCGKRRSAKLWWTWFENKRKIFRRFASFKMLFVFLKSAPFNFFFAAKSFPNRLAVSKAQGLGLCYKTLFNAALRLVHATHSHRFYCLVIGVA